MVPLTGTLISRFVGCAMFRFRIQLSAQFRQCVGGIIFPCNESFYEEAADLAPIAYGKHPGVHGWYFWDTYLQEVMDWLPLA